MSTEAEVMDQWLSRYGEKAGAEGPLLYVKEVLGVKRVDRWQADLLRAFGRGERQMSVRACHGPGKTAVAAWCVTYNLLFRWPQRTVATAPSKGQLEGALVAEIHKWINRMPAAVQAMLDVKSLSVTLINQPKSSSFEARTARAENPEALQGVHEDDGWVLLIADEASGVHEKIFEASGGSMSGDNCQMLLLSNPVRTSGFFYDTHHKLKDMWYTVHISHEDSERVTDAFVEEQARRFGRGTSAFRVRAEGNFPLSDLDTIIPFEYVESARDRDIIIPYDSPTVWGLDVARFGDDSNALVKRNSVAVLPDIAEWGGCDLMQTAGRVKREYKDCQPHERPEEILIDVIGYGAGIVDRLREQDLPVRGINAAEIASEEDQYRNKRTELWYNARDWLMKKNCSLPRCDGGCNRDCIHEKFAAELVSLRYIFASSGKYAAETKADMKKRGEDSPNIADAFVLSFASDAAGMVHGSSDGFGSSWTSDISRNRSMV